MRLDGDRGGRFAKTNTPTWRLACLLAAGVCGRPCGFEPATNGLNVAGFHAKCESHQRHGMIKLAPAEYAGAYDHFAQGIPLVQMLFCAIKRMDDVTDCRAELGQGHIKVATSVCGKTIA